MDKTLKDKIKQSFITKYSEYLKKEETSGKELVDLLNHVVNNFLRNEEITLPESEKQRLISELAAELLGLGPLEKFFSDPYISEIMINGPQNIYIERNGKKELSDIKFESEEQLMQLIYRLLAPTRRRVDESTPYTEIAMKDGSRMNIVIPPLALDGPVVTIRKFIKEIQTIDDLIDLGTLDRRMSDFLIACIKAKANMIFSGASGAGKTTTLNVLSSYISTSERIITIEDTAELRLTQEHVVRLETKHPTIEGKGEVSIRDLFKNSLRMRPDRIILGEIRGGEVLDMLQAICSGHTGSLSVIHGNSPQDLIYRIETMILTSGVPIFLEAIHRQIATAIHLIVHQERLLDGTRKVTNITQVRGLDKDRAILEDIFVYDPEAMDQQKGTKGRWRATGIVPSFYQLFKKTSVDLPQEIFNKD